jgi:hypothetical protein
MDNYTPKDVVTCTGCKLEGEFEWGLDCFVCERNTGYAVSLIKNENARAYNQIVKDYMELKGEN